MHVVSNTSPIWNLASIERLYFLHLQFDTVFIPREVLSELQSGRGSKELAQIQTALDDEWLKVESLTTLTVKNSLLQNLDQGEAAAIALAIENNVDRILMDEIDGRRAATSLGLKPMGVLGILLQAKLDGCIEFVKPELEKLKYDANFFIAESLFQRILTEAGE